MAGRRRGGGLRTPVFRAKISHACGIDTISILVCKGLKSFKIRPTPQEIRPQGSRNISCELLKMNELPQRQLLQLQYGSMGSDSRA